MAELTGILSDDDGFDYGWDPYEADEAAREETAGYAGEAAPAPAEPVVDGPQAAADFLAQLREAMGR